MEIIALFIPSFVAGVLMFLAPCTLPLVPAYLAFIGGVSHTSGTSLSSQARRKIFINGLLYVVGFSVVFVAIGSLAGFGGQALVAYRGILERVGGLFIAIFGLFLLRVFTIPFLDVERHIPLSSQLKPGRPISALLFGATFALGWTPCIGPILGAVLVLAATSATVAQGALLLAVFSLGLAIPFLIIAAAVGWASSHMARFSRVSSWFSYIGGILLVLFGILLMLGKLSVFTAWFFEIFSFLELRGYLLDYL